MSGRRPKPSKLRILQGNPGKRPLPKGEPVAPAGIPECPEHLGSEARAEWRRVCTELAAMGLATKVDRAALAAYCWAWESWLEADRELKAMGRVFKTEKGYLMPNPSVAIANTAVEQMRKFLIEFGLTPASRSRVKVAKPKTQDDEIAEYFQAAEETASVN